MIWLWIGFFALVLLLLAIDLGIFHRHSHTVSIRESLTWVAVWTTLSVCFSFLIYYLYQYRPLGLELGDLNGRQAALLYLTGYIIEESLSMDNMFVIAMILTYFRVPSHYQHRVLFWGIIGAMVMRLGMIGAGSMLVQRFDWILYLFGAFLIFSAYRMIRGIEHIDPQKSFLVRLAEKILPVSREYHEQRFFVRQSSKLMLTPLSLALLAVEGADVVFAVDSIPAIFAITDVPFLIFTSNVFAILGLRSLYFALAGMMNKFRFLKVSLSVLLALIGAKMLLKDVLHDVPGLIYYTLGAVVLVLAIGIVASILYPSPPEEISEKKSPR